MECWLREVSDAHFNREATHACVASDSSLLVIISLVVKHNVHFEQLDVKMALLDSCLAREMWVWLPDVYIHLLGHSFAKIHKPL